MDGFGDPGNHGISVIDMAESVIVAGTENFKAGAGIYRIAEDGQWTLLKRA